MNFEEGERQNVWEGNKERTFGNEKKPFVKVM